MKTLDAHFPEKLDFLFTPSRYKVAHGGRGSAKSWSFARALLIMGYQRTLRVMCAREYQNSIQESVHRLLSEQVTTLGLDAHYQVLQSEIRGKNGTEFVFAGIKTDPNKIKSAEGFDVCWIEEAEKVSEESWRVLVPTLRKESSEIWITFNPHLMTDATYQRFVVNPPASAIVRQVNWRDNPWFPAVLEEERLEMERSDPEMYLHVWEGQCLQVGDNQLIGMEEAYTAARRKYEPADYAFSPKILGVDVAREGRDRSVIFFRQGLVSRKIGVFQGMNNMTLAGEVARAIQENKPDAVFIDLGRGEGVVDRLQQLGYSVIGVNFGGTALNPRYANKRAEMWDLAARWVKERGQIPNDPELIADLCAPTYDFADKSDRISITSKAKLKALGHRSPDIAEGLVLTFAFPVAAKDPYEVMSNNPQPRDYNPYANAVEV